MSAEDMDDLRAQIFDIADGYFDEERRAENLTDAVMAVIEETLSQTKDD